jgi:glucans biosynthesis protein
MNLVPALCRRLARLASFAFAMLGAWAIAQAAETTGFDFERVAELARKNAQAPYRPGQAQLPADLLELDYDGYRQLRFQPAMALWRDARLPFEAMFFHLGKHHRQPVRIHELSPQGERRIPYRSDQFDFGKGAPSPQRWGDLGFAGLRIHYPLNNAGYKDELIAFLGASYFRALGSGQQYGLSARGLAIDPTGGSGEEFPAFTDFWLERPAADAKQLTIHALLDSPRATGAYRFDITPGAETVSRVRARIFLRPTPGKPIATLGIAPLTSMFFFGENQPRRADFRPEVHDSDGLMVATGSGEWLWRPLQNPARPTATSFAMESLRGFGLMQRDRAFASYEDVEARYERRPSAWIRPLGDWGPGRVELLQLPTPDETHDNVVAYWVPAVLPAPGTPLDFAYEIGWQGDKQQQPPGSWATQSRRGIGYLRESASAPADQVQYVVDFAGPALEALPADAAVRAVVSADSNGRLLEQLAYRNPATQSWRMTVRVQRLDATRPVELRAFLQHDNHILSETWTNIILPE